MATPLKTLLNKKTIVSTSIGTLMAMTGGVYLASEKVQATVYQVAANTTAIETIKINNVRRYIADLKRERRELRRELRASPDDPYLLEDMDEVEDTIEAAEHVLECLTDPESEVCGNGTG
jgi:hypothetical protein